MSAVRPKLNEQVYLGTWFNDLADDLQPGMAAYDSVVPNQGGLPAIRFQVLNQADFRVLGKVIMWTSLQVLVVLVYQEDEITDNMLALSEDLHQALDAVSGQTSDGILDIISCVRESPFFQTTRDHLGTFRSIGGIYRVVVAPAYSS